MDLEVEQLKREEYFQFFLEIIADLSFLTCVILCACLLVCFQLNLDSQIYKFVDSSNGPQVPMCYRLINEFFECSTNIPSGLSAYNP